MHRRSHSSASDNHRRFVFNDLPPLPPPRSAPPTVRKRRRDVGDRVFITSPTTIYLEFLDENLLVCERQGYFRSDVREIEEEKKTTRKCCDRCDENDCDDNGGKSGGFASFRWRTVESGGEEVQEINVYIGKHQSFRKIDFFAYLKIFKKRANRF